MTKSIIPLSRPASAVMLIAATATFALIRPRQARTLAAAILVASTLLIAWLGFWPQPIAAGLVTQVVDDGPVLLAAVAPPLGDPFALRAPTSGAAGLGVGNLVVVYGDRDGALIEPQHIGIAPITRDMLMAAFETAKGVLSGSRDGGVWIVALALVVFAPLLLCATNAALIAALLGGLVFVLGHWNAATQTLALPVSLIDPATLSAALAGGAIGFKAATRERYRLWSRLAALLLALPLPTIMAMALDVPQTWFLPILPLALLLPTLPILVLATLIAAAALELAAVETALLFAGLTLLRVIAARLGRGHDSLNAGEMRPPPLRPDENGNVPLHTLLEESH